MNDSYQPNFVLKITKYLRARCNYVIYASNASKHFYQNAFGASKHWVIDSYTDVLPVQKKIYKPSDTFKLITVCNINPVKDIEFLVDIMNTLKASISFELKVVGPVHSTQRQY